MPASATDAYGFGKPGRLRKTGSPSRGQGMEAELRDPQQRSGWINEEKNKVSGTVSGAKEQ